MSRAFVKEDDGAPEEPLPDRAVSEHPNQVTARGLARLEARRDELETERLELARRADDDEAARDRLRYVDRDLRYLARRLETATVVEPPPPGGAVRFGSAVLVRDASGVAHRYTVVGEDEADPDAGLVSWVSPLARVLEGARAGETVTWKRPAGSLTLTIESVE